MKKYEAMFIIKPDLSEDQRKTLFSQINDIITKSDGKIVSSGLWSENRRLYFTLEKYHEGTYYLVDFNINPSLISKIQNSYRLNDDILRVMITHTE